MESPVEIRYAGVVIGRAQEVRSADGDSPSFFLVVREPMPVGSVLHLRTGDRETPARVVHTVESPDPAACGIEVRFIGDAEEVATEWIPPPAVVAEKARPEEEPVQTTMPLIEVKMPERPAANAPIVLVVDAEEPPVELAAAMPSSEIAAIPEAVPVAVGSSMTGALENAVEGRAAPVGAKREETVPEAEPATEAAPAADAAPAAEAALATEAVPTAVAQESGGSSAAEQPSAEEPPPARPIAGPSGRRKTKRRR